MPVASLVRTGRTWTSRPLVWITGLGVAVRLVFLAIYPEIWKLSAVFNVFELGPVAYLANFAGYKPSRMPFFDALSAVFYPVFAPLLGVKALIVFNLLVACVAIPAFYLAVSRLLDERVAVPAATLFALYPKAVVLTSSGLPEAASIAFLALSLYAFARARDSGAVRDYLLAGTFAMLSFAMFVSAVAVGVVLALFVYATDVRERLGSNSTLRALVPTKHQLAFSSVPGVVGVAYLVFGPLSYLLADVSANRKSLFLEPEAYSFLERLLRYHAYTFFDFWWHTRGFDREQGILPLLRSLDGFFGGLFPVYLSGWIAITLGLSLAMAVGLVVVARRRRAFDVALLCWVGTYFLAYTYKNLGFIGGFQTRHVSAVFPALCLLFGIGVVRIADWLRDRQLDRRLPVQPQTALTVVVALGLAVLLINGAVQGVIEERKQDEVTTDPVREVSEIVGDDSVGVVLQRDFHNMVLYSENQVRPTLIAGSNETRAELRDRHGRTVDIDVATDRTLSTANVSYLYLRVEPEYVERFPYTTPLNESRIDAIRADHETVYETHIPDGPFRTTSVDIYLLRIDGTTSTAPQLPGTR